MNSINKIKDFLEANKFLNEGKLTNKGIIAANIHEINSLTFAEIINDLNNYSTEDIIIILYKLITNKIGSGSSDEIIQSIIKWNTYYYIENEENEEDDDAEEIKEWINVTNKTECLNVLQKYRDTGTFVKTLLKINNLVREIKSLDGIIELELLSKISQIPSLILKFIATNQSIYV